MGVFSTLKSLFKTSKKPVLKKASKSATPRKAAVAAKPKTPKAARKTAREVVRRTLLAKGASRLSKGSDKGSSRLSDGSIDTLLAKGSSRVSNGTMDKASLDAVGEGFHGDELEAQRAKVDDGSGRIRAITRTCSI